MVNVNELMPTNDVIFKAMLGNPKETRGLIHFLNSVLRPEDPIVSVQIQNPEILAEHVLEKGSRLDILATTNSNEIINVECQAGSEPSMIERLLYYWSRNFSKQLSPGDPYFKLKRTVSIAVLNFNLPKNDNRYQIRGRIFDCESLKEMTNLLELHFLDLTELKGIDENNPVTSWMEFFKNPYSKEAQLICERIPEIKEAKKMFEKVKADPKCLELIRMREEANIEFGNAIANAEAKKTLEIAKKMLSDGMSVELVAKYSGLSVSEIETLK
ncbi:MAG: Rpn family recombination-promoting nuclease/putative transposase [Alphaproteobacteria bacterium]|nr:Rpn family recombination-promoting nuclease/putative transposase [Alphaproteobacteria bacterium]